MGLLLTTIYCDWKEDAYIKERLLPLQLMICFENIKLSQYDQQMAYTVNWRSADEAKIGIHKAASLHRCRVVVITMRRALNEV